MAVAKGNVGRRQSPRRPTTSAGASNTNIDALSDSLSALTAAASTSPEIASTLEDLCGEAVTAMQAILEHGSREDRIAVFKALAPVIVKLNSQGTDINEESSAADEARTMLMGHWEDLV